MASSVLTQEVYLRLKEMIVTSELLPGTPMPENELSQRLKVSRTPYREALRILESEGLVEKLPHRGARVTQIGLDMVVDAYEAREWVEPKAAAKAAETMDAQALAELKAVFDSTAKQPTCHEEWTRYLEADEEFHRLIVQATSNRLVQAMFNEAFAINRRAAYYTPPGQYAQSHEEHEAILRALMDHDPETAERLMYQHISGSFYRKFGAQSHRQVKQENVRASQR